jgi:flagellar biogenesis protein FliO
VFRDQEAIARQQQHMEVLHRRVLGVRRSIEAT